MKVSIIDVGTKSIKHAIFDVNESGKGLVHFRRYSYADLGKDAVIDGETIERNVAIMEECHGKNEREGVRITKIIGTDVFRKAPNAAIFSEEVKSLFGSCIETLTHQKEAEYLYKGFLGIVPDGLKFGAVNIGGGSTEVVVGDSSGMISFHRIPFGVNFLRTRFFGKYRDWKAVSRFLENNMHVDMEKPSVLFITGVLDFLDTVKDGLGFVFQGSDIPGHPFKVDTGGYGELVSLLQATPVEKLKKLYTKDPGYADNFALGQTVYLEVARKLGVPEIVPSDVDIKDGILNEIIKS